ncbi:hypothetical protein AUR04nite_27940 [Glutamicibacter uratoxydans]|uniref:Uncharacterized protein n=1 Tax=Glutamicibacter uratoxydans TaxID=43667 RepID=A0A4Y4DPK2_GLUUR|nr:hypothetical protein [Glutamicibacter uratoxydans]GED07262.1 hypothetical protein AUR04nite_27940 [Glutamicibacter uratoxydans]
MILNISETRTGLSLLRADLEHSKEWGTTGNVFLEGSQLQVLQILQLHYQGSMKMVFLDPLAQDIDQLRRSLELSWNLLADHGAIFIWTSKQSMDGLKNLCDEIFGKKNFLDGAGQFPRNAGATPALPEARFLLSYARTIKNRTAPALSTLGFDMASSARSYLLPTLLEATQLGKDDTLLDLSAGGINTAEALLRMNALDAGSRRFMLVRPAQPLPSASATTGGTVETVAELSRDQLRRTGAALSEYDNGQLTAVGELLDTGFRAYQLPDAASAEATQEDLFIRVLAGRGFSLTERTASRSVNGIEVRAVVSEDGQPRVLAYLDARAQPTLELLEALLAQNPESVIVIAEAFHGDALLEEEFHRLALSRGIEFWTS